MALSIVALKGILAPEEFVSLNVIKLSTFVSVMSVSSMCRTALSKVIVIFESTATDVLLFVGLNVKDGGEVGAAIVNVIFEIVNLLIFQLLFHVLRIIIKIVFLLNEIKLRFILELSFKIVYENAISVHF